uniref:Uncharacterized protein n=1 Tax=mine drainage metagenome TaxID=410659 RepID=E6QQ44_9ZZZZ
MSLSCVNDEEIFILEPMGVAHSYRRAKW